jgi:hypothetical protein
MPPDEVRNWRLGEPRWGGRVGARTVPAVRREQPDDLERLAAAESQRWVDALGTGRKRDGVSLAPPPPRSRYLEAFSPFFTTMRSTVY